MVTTSPPPAAYSGWILFERGYRAFFLGAGIFAAFAIPLWLAAFIFGVEIPTNLPARDYHIHEMIYGYVGAVIAGFLFTAMPNWTGRAPVVGLRLGLLFALWLAGRIAMATSAVWPLGAAVIDVLFLISVSAVAWREVVAGRNYRNMPLCLAVSLLALTNIAYQTLQFTGNDTAIVERSAFGLIALLIALIGGRVVPAFSGNWMKSQKISPLPVSFSTYDKVSLVATVFVLLSWIIKPEAVETGYLFAGLAVLHTLRLWRWRGWKTVKEPLVLILHIGYSWLPLWFALTGLSILSPDVFLPSSALHALSAGAIGTMTIAIMTRAILGHSGNRLTSSRITQVIYLLIVTGSLLRVLSGGFDLDFISIIPVSGILWAGGFALFVLSYGQICLKRKTPRE